MKKSMYELVSEWRQEVSEEIGATDGGTDHDHAMLHALQTVLNLLDSDPSSVMQPPPEPFTLPVVSCHICGHGIDPHGVDPGGPCGVSGCQCLWSPNDIAAISAEVFKKADRYDALRAEMDRYPYGRLRMEAAAIRAQERAIVAEEIAQAMAAIAREAGSKEAL